MPSGQHTSQPKQGAETDLLINVISGDHNNHSFNQSALVLYTSLENIQSENSSEKVRFWTFLEIQ